MKNKHISLSTKMFLGNILPLIFASTFIIGSFLIVLVNMPEDFALYYGTLISRYEPGGFYSDSSGWNPDAGWLPPERPWFQDAVKNSGEFAITDPYVDTMTNSICTTISKDVKD